MLLGVIDESKGREWINDPNILTKNYVILIEKDIEKVCSHLLRKDIIAETFGIGRNRHYERSALMEELVRDKENLIADIARIIKENSSRYTIEIKEEYIDNKEVEILKEHLPGYNFNLEFSGCQYDKNYNKEKAYIITKI